LNSLEAQIEELLYNKAADLEIAKVLKKDIKIYFDTLEETFFTSGGKDFLVRKRFSCETYQKDRQYLANCL